jgi:ubiquinone/menaquinone biosynthesis C-methylase UbiE
LWLPVIYHGPSLECHPVKGAKELILPSYRNHIIVEVARGFWAFLRLEAGLVRGVVPDLEQMFEQVQDRLRQRDRQLERMRRRLSDADEHARELRQTQNRLRQKEQQLEQTLKQLSSTRANDFSEALSYEALYEARIRATSPDVAIGAGSLSFDAVGRLELEVLKREGLEPTDTLVDLGCGSGRLAIQVVPTLVGGHYIGIDISRSMLDEARKRIETGVPDPPCRVSWIHQTTPVFALDDKSVEMVCAFSVINHMEHEDAYLYFKEALRIVRPGGHFVFSCLPMNTERAREVFFKSASMDMQARHRRVRHVVTSKDLITDIVRLAGWTPVRWYDGDEEIQLTDSGESHKFHQSILVLEAPREDGEA